MNQQVTVYLDNNATTQCAPEVIEAMLPFFAGNHGNAASPHLLGQQAARAVALARDRIGASVGCAPSEICFTSCATEANNLVILGVTQTQTKRNKIVASTIEHKSVLGPCEAMADKGFNFEQIPIRKDGLVDLDAARCVIDERTLLVSVQGANNEIGTIQPVRELADIAHEHGAAFHCDAAQLLGKRLVSLDEIGADFASFSSHKAYGPKGIGFLVMKNRVRNVSMAPILYGGGQENGFRPGTLNVPGIVGAGEACRLCDLWLKDDMRRIESLRLLLEQGLIELIPESRVIVRESPRLPGTVSVMFPGVPADLLIARTTTVCMSMGSACTSGTVTPSHVLLALGLSRDEVRSVVRFSLGRYNTVGDVQSALRSLSCGVREILAGDPKQESDPESVVVAREEPVL
jgi:cysteine desulfurase